MDWEEGRPRPVRQVTIGEDLTGHSLGELEQRIETLTLEIERVRAELARKRAHGEAAASIFKR